ncbi:MAG: DUF2330 domain-containing protein [Polyangiaceae bacterium]
MNRTARTSSRLAVSCAALLGALVAAPRAASAFCGFYVSGADKDLFADATQVVLMRDGTRTVLSMQNDYKGPPEDFALVVPVPVVLQKENVKTLSADVFKRIDTLSAPRLVEYWEQDPCPTGIGLGNIGTIGHGAGTGTGQGFGTGHGRMTTSVKVEARFEVGEYEIVILSATDSSGLDTWLRDNKYKIPANAEPALKPYVAAGSKFFVAKVNVSKVKFEDGRATLSPLRFHYDTDKLVLPVKLGLLNSGGTQDLIVHILAAERYEVANYPNVTIPTNLDVNESARASFGSFYAALFDRTLEKNPRAVVTEYAWQATNCDPCPGSAAGMSGVDLVTLGADVMPSMHVSGGAAGSASVRQGAIEVKGALPREVVQRVVRQSFGRFNACYGAGQLKNPNLAGRVTIEFVIGPDGRVQRATHGSSTLPDASVVECVTKSVGALQFPEPGDKKKVSVVYPVVFAPGSGRVMSRASVSIAGSRGGLILTRLHARYDKGSLGEDLVFRKAEPIVGGREILRDGKLDHGATKTTGSSSFQGRYAIRHPWTGKIACAEPRRGVWGPRWPDVDAGAEDTSAGLGQPTAVPAANLAYVPRNASLASFTNVTAAELTGTSLGEDPDAGSTASVDAGTPAAPTRSSRCGCRAVGDANGVASPFGALLLGMLAAMRRASRRGDADDEGGPARRR